MEFTLLGAVVLAFAPMWITDRRQTERPPTFDVLLNAAIVGLAVGRIASMIGRNTPPWQEPGLIPFVRAGVDTGWASLGAIVALVYLTRKDSPTVRAAAAVPAVIGLAGWEAGCLVTGSCAGIAVGGSAVPSGLIAAAGLVVVAVIVVRVPAEFKLPSALVGAALIRLGVEPLRSALDHRVAWWYLAGAVTGLIWLWSNRRHRSGVL